MTNLQKELLQRLTEETHILWSRMTRVQTRTGTTLTHKGFAKWFPCTDHKHHLKITELGREFLRKSK